MGFSLFSLWMENFTLITYMTLGLFMMQLQGSGLVRLLQVVLLLPQVQHLPLQAQLQRQLVLAPQLQRQLVLAHLLRLRYNKKYYEDTTQSCKRSKHFNRH